MPRDEPPTPALTGPTASTSMADGSYQAAVVALAERGRFGIRLGLGRTRALLRAMGNPERELRGVLIGGTNGKGSVLALTGSVLRAAGLKVGETPKPHLVSYRERLQVDGRPIEPDAFARLVREVLPIADGIARRLGPPTEFELLTALLFRWFAEERVDVAVVEVGLGGRLDATHAWDGGVAAITNVALDHMAQLGDTIPKIAKEKAAIIEGGDLAVTGARDDGLAVIRRRARRVGAPLREVDAAPLLGWDRDGIDVELPRLGRTRVALRGRHQAANVAVADAILDALAEAGIARVDDSARRQGYAEARWPGRLELLQVGGVDVLLDGAHNPAGAATLATAMDDLRPFLRPAPPAPLTLVMGAMADKDVHGVVTALAGPSGAAGLRLHGARVVTTRVASERAMPAAELAAIWRAEIPDVSVDAIEELDTALQTAVNGATGPVIVAGSLYLVGAARARWVDDPLVRDPDDGPR